MGTYYLYSIVGKIEAQREMNLHREKIEVEAKQSSFNLYALMPF